MPVTKETNGFQVSVSRNGQRFRRRFRTLQEAELWEAESLVALLKGEVPSGCQTPANAPVKTLRELADVVYAQVWAGTKGEVTATINAEAVVEVLGHDRDIREIGVADGDRLVKALREEGNSPATINRKLAALSRMLSFAADRGWVASKPRFERLKESEGRIRFLSRDEYERIVKHFVSVESVGIHPMANLTVLLTETGLRLGEALALKWEDVDRASGMIRVWVNKSDKPRSVPMSVRVGAVLHHLSMQQLPKPGDLVFPQLTHHSVRHRWESMRNALGLDDQVTPHCCRHTFASWMVQAGIPIFTVKELCGHRCIEVTMRYAHLKDETASSAIFTVFK